MALEHAHPLGTEAGQSESLLKRLQDLTRHYPFGIGILKEFIQNADDAGATWMRFALDLRHHSCERMPDPRMQPLFGPALVIESDQTFSEEDLRRVRTIGEGSKLERAGATGRFGLGFNSAYNVTDYPSFATRDVITTFDPCMDAVAHLKEGREWKLSELWEHAPDWPKAFDLVPRMQTIQGRTIFRLPLRTADRASGDRVKAVGCAPEQIRSIFDEAIEAGAELLLFLRSILQLRFEVLDPNGKTETVGTVETLNEDEVKAARGSLRSTWGRGMREILSSWRTDKDVEEVYRHEVHTTLISQGQDVTRVWQVVQSYLPAIDLLDLAKQMHQISEKAVPVGGAAALLVEKCGELCAVEPVQGRYYCFLPLPQQSEMQFHVNGFFDLSSDRKTLTFDADSRNDAAIRVNWNKGLANVVMPLVIGRLFKELASRLTDSGFASLYEIWPSLSALRQESFTGTTARALYLHLAECPVLQVRAGKDFRLTAPSKVRLFPGAWSSRLLEALADDGHEVLMPRLPPAVLDGFSSVNKAIRNWEPREVAKQLAVQKFQPSTLGSATQVALREKRYIEELLGYCTGSADTDLTSVPLALMEDGMLRAFGSKSEIWLATKDIREVFIESPRDFLDFDLQESTRIREFADEAVSILDAHAVYGYLFGDGAGPLSVDGQDGNRAWQPDGNEIPSRKFLFRLLDWLAGLPADNLTPDQTRNLALVPCRDGLLCAGGRVSTPLLLRRQDDQLLDDALQEFGVPLVQDDEETISRLIKIRERRDAEGFVRDATPENVFEYLARRSNATKSPGEHLGHDMPARTTLLNWLSSAFEKDEEAFARHMANFAELQIWPATAVVGDGATRLASPSGPGVHIGSGFTPPAIRLNDLLLLEPGRGDVRCRFLLALGARECTFERYATMLAGKLQQVSDNEKLIVLTWLRDNWRSLDPAQHSMLLAKYRAAPLVLASDGKYHAANQLYLKTANDAHRLLGDRAIRPNDNEYTDRADLWQKFFQVDLALSAHPRAVDIVNHVRDLAARFSNVSTIQAQVERHLTDILAYLADRWEGYLSENEKNLLAEHLPNIEWMVPQREVRNDEAYAFRPPEQRLFLPSEIFVPRLRNLISSQLPVLRVRQEPPDPFRKAMKMAESPPAMAILNHFSLVRSMWQTQPNNIDADAIGAVAREVYRFLGVRREKHANDPDLKKLQEALGSEASIWVQERKRFFPPALVFFDGVEHCQTYFVKADATETFERKGLAWLGVGTSPKAHDWVKLLDLIGEELGGSEVPEQKCRLVRMALARLTEDIEGNARIVKNLLLLTSAHLLVRACQTLVPDADWIQDRLRGEPQIHWIAPEVSGRLAEVAGAIQASSIREVIVRHERTDDSALAGYCAKYRQRLQSAEFLDGVARVIWRESKRLVSAEDIAEFTELEFVPCRHIVTCLVWPSAMERPASASGQVGCHFDDENATVYISERDERALVPELARLLSAAVAVYGTMDRAAVEEMLRIDPAEIPACLARRRIARLPSQGDLAPEDYVEIGSAAEAEDWPDARDDSDRGVYHEHVSGDGPENDLTVFAHEPHWAEASAVGSDRQLTALGLDQKPGIGAAVVSSAKGTNGMPLGVSVPPRAEPEIAGEGSSRSPPHVFQRGYQNPDDSGSDGLHYSWQTDQAGSQHGAGQHARPHESSAVGSPDAPPVTPGTGQSSAGSRSGSRSRLVSYVESNERDSSDEDEQAQEVRNRIGRAAVAAVIANLRASGAKIREMPWNNKGYDLEVTVKGIAAPFLVEVKGLAGPWDARGVGMTATEFRQAELSRDGYWLAVVEYAETPDAMLYWLKSPATEVGEFRFDYGWMRRASSTFLPIVAGNTPANSSNAISRLAPPSDPVPRSQLPVPGMLLFKNGVEFGRIEATVTHGSAIHMNFSARPDGSKPMPLVYNASCHQVLPAVED
jgi:hypothetical protein